ncbi:ATP translocase [Kangiella sp. TOML190]|uniref:ATP translocase n=1 Tax=Kangiella sp. TOML190 TaxID=2931351 RepID=UPI00203DE3F2|nr:ATP translocase [Kangiella sp. TOML190]
MSEGSAELKSYTTAAQALILLFIVPFYSRYYYKFSKHHDKSIFLNRVIYFFITNLLVFVLLLHLEIPISIIFYVWLGVLSVTLVAIYWAFCADCFNVKSGKRLFSVIALGGSIGAWVGAKSAGWLYPIMGIAGLLLAAASLLLIVSFLLKSACRSIPVNSRAVKHIDEDEQSRDWKRGFSLIFKKKYLLYIAIFVVLVNWVNSMGEYILAKFVVASVDEKVAQGLGTEQALMTEFYTDYIAWFTLFGIALQLLIVPRLFRWIGVGGSILILPLVTLINYSLIFIFPLMLVVTWAMIAENSVNYSIQNTSRHALFLNISREEKYLSKNTIDSFFYRFGDLLYGGTIALTVGLFALDIKLVIGIAVVLSLMSLWVAFQIKVKKKQDKQNAEPNRPPTLAYPLQPQAVISGQKTILTLPENTFEDPDLGDSLRYSIKAVDGHALPKWCKFNNTTMALSVRPPEGLRQELKIEIMATDYDGLTATTLLVIDVEG